jgi:hypothetical protein
LNEPPSKDELEEQKILADVAKEALEPKKKSDDDDLGDGSFDQKSLDAMSFVQINSKMAFAAQHPHRPSDEFDAFIT